MDIVYSIDDNFIPQAAALTASVLENHASGADQRSGRFLIPQEQDSCSRDPSGSAGTFRFHILSNGISEKNRKDFSDFAESRGAKASFYDLGDFESRLEKILGAKPETGRFVKAALGRIFAAEYLPEDVERFLYLDADMIARQDIAPLFELDLKDCVLAAVAEPTIYEDLTVEQQAEDWGSCETEALSGEQLRNSAPRETCAYFNTGLLLVDRKVWNREGITKKCLAWYAAHNGEFDFADQDILNHALAGRILPLSQRWNFQTNYHYQSYGSLVKRAPWYSKLVTKEDYEQSAADPAVVHYAGDERPWIRGNLNPYKEDFRKYLRQTPWKDTPEVKGKENYMYFYHAVNVLSEKLPGFRAAVSRIYYRIKVKNKR